MRQVSGFSIVELLVVILIVSILAALLLPTVEASIAQARIMHCANTQKQTYLGVETYMTDHRGWMLYMNQGFYPQAGADTGAYLPYWFELWPTEIRFCPTVLNSAGSPAPGGHPVVNSQLWLDRLEFGYSMLLNNTFQRPQAFDATGRYMRPRVDTWSSWINLAGQIERYSYYGKYWKHAGTDPMIACPILLGTTTSRYCVPHANPPARTTYYQDPRGTNSVWDDGHIEWHDWSSSDSIPDRRTRYTGYAGCLPEGWTRDSGSGWWWGKRSPTIE